ncbi:hypothetical protein AB0L14_21430 [Streptomyces sp. NPDC052727]|uniref:hypothetical protein n=1 Tax=Streptomyces sp. NPDC052727 TaxID=3154854 RepID=UPI00344689FE
MAEQPLTGRSWLVDLVEDWRRDLNSPRWFLLTGPSGSGKTAVSRHIATRWSPGRAVADLQPWTYVHFANRQQDGSSTNLRGFTRNLTAALVEALPGFGAALAHSMALPNMYINQVIEHNDGAVYGLFAQNLHIKHAPLEELFHDTVVMPLTRWALQSPGAHVEIMVDGVDESIQEDGKSLATLLAELPVAPVSKIFVATKSDPQVLHQIGSNVRRVALDGPAFRDLHAFDVRKFIEVRAAGRSRQTIADIIARADGNFLVAESLLENMDNPTEIPGNAFVPLTLAEMYAHQLERLSHRFPPLQRGMPDGKSATLDMLGTLSTSQSPLSSAALSYLTGEPQQRSLERLNTLLPLLTVWPSAEQPQYALHHASLAAFLRSESVEASAAPNRFFSPPADAHRRFRQAFEELLRSKNADLPSDLVTYLGKHGMHHVVESAVSLSSAERLTIARSLPGLVHRSYSAIGHPLSAESIEIALRFCARAADVGTFARLLAACAQHPAEAAVPLAAAALAAWTESHGAQLIIRALRTRSEIPAAVSVGAALRLGMPEALVEAMSASRSAKVSELAAYALYLRWSAGSRTPTERLIDKIALSVRWSRPLRSRRRLSFLADVSVLLYTHNVEDRALIGWGDRLWHTLLVENLGADKFSTGLAARLLAAAAASTLSRRLASATLFANVVNPDQHFRSLGARSKMVEASRLLTSDSLNQKSDVLTSLLDSDLIMHRAIGALLIGGMANRPPGHDLETVQLMFDSGSSRRRLWILLSFSLLFEPRSPYADLVQKMTETLLLENADVILSEDSGFLCGFPVYLLPLGLACGEGLVPASALSDLVRSIAMHDGGERRALIDRLIDSLGVVGFYYPSVAFSALEHFASDQSPDHLPALTRALGRMYALHPGQVQAFIETWGIGKVFPDIVRCLDLSSVKTSMERIGFFNNAAAQIALFPVMRTELVEPCIRLLGESKTLKTFIQQYTVAFLESLHRHEFHLAKWTEQ